MQINNSLKAASSSELETYDPAHVIEAVNALVALGQDEAWKAIDKFVAAEDMDIDPHQGLFLVLRVAFDAKQHPPMRVGSSRIEAPADATKVPRFPIMMVADVPVMLVDGYALGGMAEPVSSHLAFYRANGKLRAAKLAPAKGDKSATFEQMYVAAYGAPPDGELRTFVERQLAQWKP